PPSSSRSSSRRHMTFRSSSTSRPMRVSCRCATSSKGVIGLRRRRQQRLANRIQVVASGDALLQIAELRQLGHEFRAVLRLERILILQLRDQQLKEHILTGKLAGRTGKLAGRTGKLAGRTGKLAGRGGGRRRIRRAGD